MEALQAEVYELQRRCVSVSVERPTDVAYQEPAEIQSVFEYLRERDQRLAASECEIGFRPWHSPALRRRLVCEREERLEERRRAWLFGPTETDSMDWHRQRGRAVALLTIASAHDLAEGATAGIFPAMGGPLHKAVLDVRFDRKVPGVGGLTLVEAVAMAEQRFSCREATDAARIAERRVAELAEFVAAPVTPGFRRVVRFCSDALGIRSRKDIVAARIHAHLDGRTGTGLLMSYGCGTALPMLEILQLRARNGQSVPRLVLLDQDPIALGAAAVLAAGMGLEEHIELHCERLFDRWGRPVDLRPVLAGRELDVAEDSGLREYLPDRIYRWLTAASWKALRPGGLMTTGNMNLNRPQPEFLHGMMGWKPHVHMRSINAGLELHRSAGIPSRATHVTVTPDGVYSLFFSNKPSGGGLSPSS